MEVKTMNDIPLDEWKILDVFYQATYLLVKQVRTSKSSVIFGKQVSGFFGSPRNSTERHRPNMPQKPTEKVKFRHYRPRQTSIYTDCPRGNGEGVEKTKPRYQQTLHPFPEPIST